MPPISEVDEDNTSGSSPESETESSSENGGESDGESGSQRDGSSTSSGAENVSPPAPAIGRKRKASEMENGSSTTTEEITESSSSTTTEEGAGASGSSAAEETTQSSGVMSETSVEAPDAVEEDGQEFTILCPISWRDKERFKHDTEIFMFKDHPLNFRHLRVEFAVRPGQAWNDLERFRNATYRSPEDPSGKAHDFRAGQYVFVNRHTPPPPPLPEEAPDGEQLQYCKDNFWVALISEFKAVNSTTVLLRVYWLYWPDELPMGRQPYHGKRELILSNKVDLIEVQTIATYAPVCQWKEQSERKTGLLDHELFWRQTYNINKPQHSKVALSKLRQHCVCHGYDNPDKEMYLCYDCELGNHEACLIADMERRAWKKFQAGTLADEEPQADGPSPGKTKKRHTLRRPAQGPKPWAGKLEGSISRTGQYAIDEYIHAATVRQLVPQPGERIRGPFVPAVWKMNLDCLRCGKPLNREPL